MRRRNNRVRRFNEHELLTVRHQMWSNVISSIGREIIRWGCIVFCVYRVSLVGIEWAGKWTVADVDVKIDTGIPGFWLVNGAWAIITVSGLIYGMNQARLRRQTIRHFEDSKKTLEIKIDPRRSSSQLTKSGETPSEEG